MTPGGGSPQYKGSPMTDQLTPKDIRRWRKEEARMSQPEFAGMLGLSVPTIARWEGGEGENIPKWAALARDGWRTRQRPQSDGHQLTEEDVRRIVREEISAS